MHQLYSMFYVVLYVNSHFSWCMMCRHLNCVLSCSTIYVNSRAMAAYESEQVELLAKRNCRHCELYSHIIHSFEYTSNCCIIHSIELYLILSYHSFLWIYLRISYNLFQDNLQKQTIVSRTVWPKSEFDRLYQLTLCRFISSLKTCRDELKAVCPSMMRVQKLNFKSWYF